MFVDVCMVVIYEELLDKERFFFIYSMKFINGIKN